MASFHLSIKHLVLFKAKFAIQGTGWGYVHQIIGLELLTMSGIFPFFSVPATASAIKPQLLT